MLNWKNTKHWITRFGAATAAASLGLAVFGAVEVSAQEKVVQIGVLAPLTGDAAADGEETLRGVQLAVEEANKDGKVKGYRFEVVPGDTGDLSSGAVVSAIQRLTREPNLHVILAGYGSNTNFEIEYIAELGLPYILSGNAAQTEAIISPNPEKFPTIWSFISGYEEYETALPKVLENQIAKNPDIKFRDRSVAIISSDNPYSMSIYEGLKTNFEAAGWTVAIDEVVPSGPVNDWRAFLSRVREVNPDVIINTDYLTANGARFLGQFLEAPSDSLVFIQYAPSVPEFLELTADASTGLMYNIIGSPILTDQNPRALEITQKFKDRWGVESGYAGISLYEQANVYFDVLNKVGDPTDHLAIGEAIGAIEKNVAQGKLVFDHSTHLAKSGEGFIPIQFFQIWDGERKLFYPQAFANWEFRAPPWMKAE